MPSYSIIGLGFTAPGEYYYSRRLTDLQVANMYKSQRLTLCILYIVNRRTICYNAVSKGGVFMPVPKTGKRSEKQRQTLNRYQKENYIVIAAKIKKSDAERLRAALEQEGQTVNSFLTACAMTYLEEHPAPELQAEPEE